MRLPLLLASLALSFLLGWLGHAYYLSQSGPTVEERVAVLNTQVRKIAQLATAEQRQSLWLNRKDVGYLDLPGFRKRLMLNSRARITAGFDLEGIAVDVDEDARVVTVRDWPVARELSFEVDTQVFDLDQGVFNTYDATELNAAEERLRRELRAKVDYGALIAACYEQADDLLGALRAQLELSGWRLEVEWPEDDRVARRG